MFNNSTLAAGRGRTGGSAGHEGSDGGFTETLTQVATLNSSWVQQCEECEG